MALSGKITDFGVPESRVVEVPKLDSPSEKLRVWVYTNRVSHTYANKNSQKIYANMIALFMTTVATPRARWARWSPVVGLVFWEFLQETMGFLLEKLPPNGGLFPQIFPRHRKVPDSHRKLSSKLGMDGSQTCQTLVKMCYIMLYHSF